MVDELNRNSPWEHIVAVLSQNGPRRQQASIAEYGRDIRGSFDPRWPEGVKIQILERLSAQAVSVAWAHPCSGYVGCQTWRRSKARKHGVCSLTGEQVRRGEPIYKISRSVSSACSVGGMLLARHVDAIFPCADRMQAMGY
ncbi:uncharacterized protein DUF3331 [Paraburkholderia unamae]|uniref:DUF3331 domain-containing protein n=1 Tax=Paraburkholderia unamae TaxID=219649 RepID=UPI000DC26A63|nr:uncharacterized protein DUF3331 [Paraburkholderia unamae]